MTFIKNEIFFTSLKLMAIFFFSFVGADILNLKKIGNQGVPVASIGGAGTFDGIFLNGIFAVLLAAVLSGG